MRLFEVAKTELQPFSTDPNTPNQIDMMKDPEYMSKKKGMVGEIVWMSPEEYIERSERGFRSIGEPGLVRQGRDPKLVKQYAQDMKRGDKFPMLELDYRGGFAQEGLHRAMAAEMIGVNKVPVFVTKESPEFKAKRQSEWEKTKAQLKKRMDGWDKDRQSDVVDDILGAFESTLTEDYYIGNCTMDEVVDDIFGNVSEFARLVDEYGDDFEIGDYKIVYDDDKDIHSFYIKENLTEGISPVVYHSVSGITSLLSILEQDRFKLTASPGTDTERALQKGDRFYYLSTTRHKLGGYHLNPYQRGYMLNLDGAKLAQRYAGKPVDYWGPEWYKNKEMGGKGPEEKEAEDRIYSYKPFIPNASKYIREIHILLDPEGYESQEEFGIYYRRLAILAKKRGIPLFIYDNKQDWLTQNKAKATPITKIDIITKAKGKDRDQRDLYLHRRQYLAPWIELYMAPVGSKISKEAERTRYNYVLYGYSDSARSLAAEIHNAKSKPADETGLETLLKIFRKEKIRSPQEYIDLLYDKWKPKEESLQEYKEVSNWTDDEEGNIFGYVVDTDEEQLVNYFVLNHGVKESVINAIRKKYSTVAVARNISVDEEHQNKGHGTELMGAFIEEVAGEGAEAILCVADTLEDNEFDLVKWYEGWGFETVAQTGSGPFMVMEL